jgi:hypothetical protein
MRAAHLCNLGNLSFDPELTRAFSPFFGLKVSLPFRDSLLFGSLTPPDERHVASTKLAEERQGKITAELTPQQMALDKMPEAASSQESPAAAPALMAEEQPKQNDHRDRHAQQPK